MDLLRAPTCLITEALEYHQLKPAGLTHNVVSGKVQAVALPSRAWQKCPKPQLDRLWLTPRYLVRLPACSLATLARPWLSVRACTGRF